MLKQMSALNLRQGNRRHVGMAVLVALALAGCGGEAKQSGQALASVDGKEITALQLNGELQRANITPAQQEQASKQLLESLIDRQLLQNAAERDKVDRDPKVVQAIERARAQIIAQAYIQKRIGSVAKPTPEEITAYYQKHPEFFAERKMFDMRQLLLATKDVTDVVTKAIDERKNLPDVARWLDSQGIKYTAAQISRTGSDLPPAMSAKLLTLPPGQLFIVREGERSVLTAITSISPSPVSAEQAAPQIGQYLLANKTKEAAAAEVAQLRTAAKIEYLKAKPPGSADKAPAAAAAPGSTPAAPAVAPGTEQPAAPAGVATDEATARGVAGLK